MKPSAIRALLLAFFATVLLLAGPAPAAPTCQDRNGLTIKCGVQGAMPVGWSLPFEERRFKPAGPSASELLGLIATIGLLFALIALLPEFDGTSSSDWDKQEGDDQERV
jgi:hypothetical protein